MGTMITPPTADPSPEPTPAPEPPQTVTPSPESSPPPQEEEEQEESEDLNDDRDKDRPPFNEFGVDLFVERAKEEPSKLHPQYEAEKNRIMKLDTLKD